MRHPIQQTETRTLGETVVPIMTTGRRVAYLAAVAITLGVGLAGLIALLTGSVDGGSRTGIVISTVGTLLIFALLAFAGPRVLRRRDLLIGPRGIAMITGDRMMFSCGWPELAAVTVSYYWRRTGRYRILKTWRVHLNLDPADQLFAHRHPEMDVFRRSGKRGYPVLLGPYKGLIAPLDGALRQHAPGIYRGAVRDR